MKQTYGDVGFVAGVSRFFFAIPSKPLLLDPFGAASIDTPPTPLSTRMPDSKPIEILLEDPWFLVVSKPVDLLTQAIESLPSLQSQLIKQLSLPDTPKPFIGMPHRLDRMTSGTIVVARNQRALRRLCDQFAVRTVIKEYLAWVSGQPPTQGTWEDIMRKVPDEPRAELATSDQEHAKPASLDYQVLETRLDAQGHTQSLLLIRLGTGRMHQIRLQSASRGHPILGDRLYGSQSAWNILDHSDPSRFREPPLALHAYRLTFHHPKTAEKISAIAPPPKNFPWGDYANQES
jgi:RluA family pseudouridine synthase